MVSGEHSPGVDEEGNPEPPEPHVHGGQINQQTGAQFIADEGSSCYITRIPP